MPVLSTHDVYWPMTSSSRLVAERGPSTQVYAARASPANPTPLQLGTAGSELGTVIETFGDIVTMSRRPVWPSTMPPNPMPKASEKLRVSCQVGSSVPPKRRPDSPPDSDADA